MSGWTKPGERIDDLMTGSLNIIQHPDEFCFGTDSVLLAHFAGVKKGDKVLDLGTGTGIIALLIAAGVDRTHITAVEIQERLSDMARRSVAMNALDERIHVKCEDIRKLSMRQRATDPFSPPYDVVVCNPPYRKKDSGDASVKESVRIARHEVEGTLKDFVKAGSEQLKTRGRFCIVHEAERLAELFKVMYEHNLVPKRLTPVAPRAGEPPNLVLAEGMLRGADGLRIMPTLNVNDDDGNQTEQVRGIYDEWNYR